MFAHIFVPAHNTLIHLMRKKGLAKSRWGLGLAGWEAGWMCRTERGMLDESWQKLVDTDLEEYWNLQCISREPFCSFLHARDQESRDKTNERTDKKKTMHHLCFAWQRKKRCAVARQNAFRVNPRKICEKYWPKKPSAFSLADFLFQTRLTKNGKKIFFFLWITVKLVYNEQQETLQSVRYSK